LGHQLRRHQDGARHLPPLLLAVLRFALALLPALWWVPRPKVGWRPLAAYGVLIGAGQFGLLYMAIDGRISPGLASLVVQTQVFFTIGLAMLADGERVRGYQWLALLLATAGIGVIATHTGGDITLAGLLMVLCGALAWAGGNQVARRMGRVDMLGVVVWSSAFALPPLLALSLLVEGPARISQAWRRPGRRVGRGGLADGGQHPVRLQRLGLAAGPPPGGHGLADGPAGAGVRHGRFGPAAG
jgi:O-acetylserine/cysteine efflux transporter